jgi:CSLREA domain-containing protein
MRRSALSTVFLLAALDASAATFVVTNTTDAGDATPGDGICSWMTGICTLRAAIQESNAWPGADVIQIAAGTYTLSIAGAGEDLAVTGDLDIRDTVTIEGASAATTVIDANAIDRVFDVQPMSAATLSVAIRDMTIREGALTDAGGAGIRHDDDGTLTVEDAVLTENHVSGTVSAATGGAIDAGGTGSLELRRLVLSQNSANRGGAIFHNGPLAIWDSTFEANTAAVNGSAIESYDQGSVERCTFAGNQTAVGSTLDLNAGSFTLQNSTLSGNTSGAATIGASGSSLSLESVTMFDNLAPGAGLRAYAGTTAIVNSVLWETAGVPACDLSGGTIVSLGHNLDDDDTCGAGPGDLPIQNPQLAPLTDNGGLTETHLPAPGSPLANTGLDSACQIEDQRGYLRNLGPANACDIGSVEFSVPEPTATLAGVTCLGALALLRRRH